MKPQNILALTQEHTVLAIGLCVCDIAVTVIKFFYSCVILCLPVDLKRYAEFQTTHFREIHSCLTQHQVNVISSAHAWKTSASINGTFMFWISSGVKLQTSWRRHKRTLDGPLCARPRCECVSSDRSPVVRCNQYRWRHDLITWRPTDSSPENTINIAYTSVIQRK